MRHARSSGFGAGYYTNFNRPCSISGSQVPSQSLSVDSDFRSGWATGSNLSAVKKVKKQSASAAAAEEAALRARIAVVRRLHEGLSQPSSTIAQALAAYDDILEGLSSSLPGFRLSNS